MSGGAEPPHEGPGTGVRGSQGEHLLYVVNRVYAMGLLFCTPRCYCSIVLGLVCLYSIVLAHQLIQYINPAVITKKNNPAREFLSQGNRNPTIITRENEILNRESTKAVQETSGISHGSMSPPSDVVRWNKEVKACTDDTPVSETKTYVGVVVRGAFITP